MPRIKLNDLDVYYEIAGTGAPLVLIAGYTCDHAFFAPLVEKLKTHYQVVTFDNRAIGQTKDAGTPFSIEDMAQDTVSLINHLKLNKPSLLGHSMGGLIVQAIAQCYATEIHKLIIMNSAAVLSTRTKMVLKNLLHFLESNLSLEDQVNNGLPWFCSNEFLSKPDNISEYLEIYKKNPYPQSIPDQKRQLDALLAFNASSWLHEIKNPALIINTLEDIIATESDSQMLADQIPHAQLVRLGGAHVLEAIDDAAIVIREFLVNNSFATSL